MSPSHGCDKTTSVLTSVKCWHLLPLHIRSTLLVVELYNASYKALTATLPRTAVVCKHNTTELLLCITCNNVFRVIMGVLLGSRCASFGAQSLWHH